MKKKLFEIVPNKKHVFGTRILTGNLSRQGNGNDKLDFICDEDFEDREHPETWKKMLDKLKQEFATDVVIQAFCDMLNYEFLIVTVGKVNI